VGRLGAGGKSEVSKTRISSVQWQKMDVPAQENKNILFASPPTIYSKIIKDIKRTG
jgi:hypothetical protein